MDNNFYKNKTILVTGHTGFKGAWMCKLLQMLGANVIGYALKAPTEPAIFDLCNIADGMVSVLGDVRNKELLREVFQQYKPEIVIHMAAQPIVRESYVNPVYTYETNIMGTVNVGKCANDTIREVSCKCYNGQGIQKQRMGLGIQGRR